MAWHGMAWYGMVMVLHVRVYPQFSGMKSLSLPLLTGSLMRQDLATNLPQIGGQRDTGNMTRLTRWLHTGR